MNFYLTLCLQQKEKNASLWSLMTVYDLHQVVKKDNDSLNFFYIHESYVLLILFRCSCGAMRLSCYDISYFWTEVWQQRAILVGSASCTRRCLCQKCQCQAWTAQYERLFFWFIVALYFWASVWKCVHNWTLISGWMVSAAGSSSRSPVRSN